MDSAEIGAEVVYSAAPGQTDAVALRLPAGATVAEALLASGLLERHGLSADGLRVGVWGRLRDPGSPLRERDRIEIYRPLKVDPKEARRQRYRRHRDAKNGV
jgi:putative ubiquitin-RnfH superfamily antitoxin RatB of RatAB toxin-antitoxin module